MRCKLLLLVMHMQRWHMHFIDAADACGLVTSQGYLPHSQTSTSPVTAVRHRQRPLLHL